MEEIKNIAIQYALDKSHMETLETFKSIVKLLVDHVPSEYYEDCEELTNNREMIVEMIKIIPDIIIFDTVPKKFKSDIELILLSLKHGDGDELFEWMVSDVPEIITNQSHMVQIVKYYPKAISHIPDNALTPQFLADLTESNEEVVNYLNQ